MRFIPIALLLVASTANAANWVRVADLDSKGSVVFVDTVGIAQVDGLRKAWFKDAYTSDQPIPNGIAKARSDVRFYRRSLSLNFFNCAERKIATGQVILHSADDQVVGTFAVEQFLLTYQEVPPETIGETMLETVCGWEFMGDTPVQPISPPKPKTGDPTPAEPREQKLRDALQAGSPAMITSPVNPADFYPPGSIRRNEQGSPVVLVCVGPNGRLLRDPVVSDSSGFPDLDGAAIKVARASKYAPGTAGGSAMAESCIKYEVRFTLKNN